jgi:cysteine desulfurase/selenocysteine lyase
MIDIERARRDTPGCEGVLHFNNAGAALPPRPVSDAVVRYLTLEAEIGGYEAEDRRAADFDRVYDSLATLLGAHRDEIAVTDSATRSWDLVFYSIPFRAGDRILVSHAEYVSNYIALLQVARRTGAEIVVVPDDADGQISVEALRGLLDERVKLIALTHVPTSSGLVNPAEAVGRVAREAGVLYLLDACQSAGQLPLDVRAIGCDFLSATGRKFLRAPRGTGLLFVRREIIETIEPVFLDMHAATWVARDRFEIRKDARRFESLETSFAGKLGLGAAVEYALALGLPAIAARVGMLAEKLRARLAAIRGVTVRDRGVKRCGIVTFTADGFDPTWIRTQLRALPKPINIWVSNSSSARLDLEARGIASVGRASVHYYNTEDEIEAFAVALERLISA